MVKQTSLFTDYDVHLFREGKHYGIYEKMGGHLHSFEGENTALVQWPANEVFLPHRHFGGEEIFVLSGTFCDEYGDYPQYTWLRSPHMSQHHPFVKEPTIIWVKTGHLPVVWPSDLAP